MNGRMPQLHDVGQLLVMVLIVIGLFSVLISGRVQWESVDQYMTAITMFVFGQGTAVIRKRAPSPLVTPSVAPTEVATATGTVTIEPEHLITAARLIELTARDVQNGDLPTPDPDFWKDHRGTQDR